MKVICVENLSKKYRIGEAQGKYRTLRDTLVSKFRRNVPGFETEIWALKDVSFEVEQGEVVGIIGRNGAGKSTLLKILAHITRPTEGRVTLHGRVGSLLEVGTGFSNELTGRENIYLNGAVLGMRRREIERKFDEIVDFAEVEKFLDTPVKHYSSGMYMRLAFAVAAHLEPEILLVDEVLAVGDATFQNKCLGKMGEVAEQGRTVLFVSHNMAALGGLCTSGILLDNGKLILNHSMSTVIQNYMQRNNKQSMASYKSIKGSPRRANEGIIFRYDYIELDVLSQVIETWKPLVINLGFVASKSLYGICLGIEVYKMDGYCVFSSDSQDSDVFLDIGASQKGSANVVIPHHNLSPGRYMLRVIARSGNILVDWVDDALQFEVSKSEGSIWSSLSHLGMRPQSKWEVKLPEDASIEINEDQLLEITGTLELIRPSFIEQQQKIINELKQVGIDHLTKLPNLGWNYILDHIWITMQIGAFLQNNKQAKCIILDVGTGQSPLHSYLENKYGIQITGIDRLKGYCLQSTLKNVDHYVDFLEFDALVENSVDVIYWLSSIEHNQIEIIQKLYKKSYSLLRKGGMFLATLPISSKTQWFEASEQTNFSIFDCMSVFELSNSIGKYNSVHEEYRKNFLYLRDKYKRRYGHFIDSDPMFIVGGIKKIKN
jgi:lipopolysaccharide transport system ATP-binding protein